MYPQRAFGLLLALACGAGAAQAPDQAQRQDAVRQVERCTSVVQVHCAHLAARDPAQALGQDRERERRRHARRAETGYEGPEFDEMEILADRIAGAREERWERFGGQIASAHRPGCLTSEAMNPDAGLLSIPIWGFLVATGRCN